MLDTSILISSQMECLQHLIRDYTVHSGLPVPILGVNSNIVWYFLTKTSHSALIKRLGVVDEDDGDDDLMLTSHSTLLELTLSLPQAIIIGFCKQHRSR